MNNTYMEYNKIIAVTGLPGLYELLSSKTDGAIVRSLDDKSTKFISSRIHNFSHLESIEIFTVQDNVNLVDVLKAMESSGEKLPDEKDAGGLKKYFTKVYPDMDFERVYSSDLKKMVKWFSVLKANQVEIKLSEPAPEEEVEEVAALVKKEKPAVKEKAEPAKEAKPAKEKAAVAPAPKAKAVEKPKVKAKAAEEEPKAKKPAAKPKAAPAEKPKAKTADKPKKAAPKKKSK
jgi:Domain of unknown function (DUF5606)